MNRRLHPPNQLKRTHEYADQTDGVAFAAIQGLNQKVEAKESRLQESNRKLECEMTSLRAQNAELRHRLERLEQLFHAQDKGAK